MRYPIWLHRGLTVYLPTLFKSNLLPSPQNVAEVKTSAKPFHMTIKEISVLLKKLAKKEKC